MSDSSLQILVDECLLTVANASDSSKDSQGLKKSIASKGADVTSHSHLKKGRVKDVFEALLESSDKASYNRTITAIAESLLKTSSEILFPTPANSQGESSGQQGSVKDRLKLTHPFSCPICDFVLSDPVTLLCGHTYCKKCLVKWKPLACRLCRKKLFPSEFDSAKCNILVSSLVKRWWQPELNAVEIRTKGNQSLSKQGYANALQLYGDALEQAPHDHITLSNRSHALVKVARNDEALSDADSAIQRQPFWAKGYFRQAAALKSLGRLEDALVACLLCAVLEENPPVEVMEELKLLLRRIVRRRHLSDGHVSKQPRRRSESSSQLHRHSDPAPVSWGILCDQWERDASPGRRWEGDASPGRRWEGDASPGRRWKRRMDGDGHPQLHSDDSSSSADVPLAARSESRTLPLDLRLRRILERCHTAATALKTREGKQYVRAVAPDLASRDDFECALCYRLLWKATSTPCGHTFCRSCIDRWLDHSPTCPLCKMALDEFLAARGRATTTFLQHAMETLLPAETTKRQLEHDQELLDDSLAGQDRHHHIPIFVCTLAFPSLPCPLHIFEPRYRLMVRRSMESGTREFGICLSSPTDSHGFVDIGVMLEIRDLQYFPDGRSVVDAVGGRRFRCLEKGQRDGYSTARAEFLTDQAVPSEDLPELQTLHDQVRALMEAWWAEHFQARPDQRARVISFFGAMPPVESSYWTLPAGPGWLWWTLAILPVPPSLQLEILSMTLLKRRLRVIGSVLRRLSPTAARS